MTSQNPQSEPVARFAVALAKSHPVAARNNSIDPDDLLGAMMADMWSGRPINPLSRWWFERGVLRSIRRGEPLDAALSLNGAGKSCIQARLLMIRRNEYLAAAAEAVALDDTVTQWQRCIRLADEATRFMRATWPTTKRLSGPPEDWPTFKKWLWFAACSDLGLPNSASGMRSALLQNTPFSRNPNGATVLAQFL